MFREQLQTNVKNMRHQEKDLTACKYKYICFIVLWDNREIDACMKIFLKLMGF